MRELRDAMSLLARKSDEHERRISAMEAQVDSCRKGTQAAAKGIVELRERESDLRKHLDAVHEEVHALRLELGGKASTSTFEALMKLKMDRKACETQFAELEAARSELHGKVDGLDDEVEQIAQQLWFARGDRNASLPPQPPHEQPYYTTPATAPGSCTSPPRPGRP